MKQFVKFIALGLGFTILVSIAWALNKIGLGDSKLAKRIW